MRRALPNQALAQGRAGNAACTTLTKSKQELVPLTAFPCKRAR